MCCDMVVAVSVDCARFPLFFSPGGGGGDQTVVHHAARNGAGTRLLERLLEGWTNPGGAGAKVAGAGAARRKARSSKRTDPCRITDRSGPHAQMCCPHAGPRLCHPTRSQPADAQPSDGHSASAALACQHILCTSVMRLCTDRVHRAALRHADRVAPIASHCCHCVAVAVLRWPCCCDCVAMTVLL